MSQPQTICILEFFKDFFACKIVLAATHHISENVQKLFRLQNCLSRKSAIYWKRSKIFPPAKLSQQQPINILKSFQDFFACKIVLAANHLYPGKIQRLFRLHSCPRRKSSISWKSSKTFSPAKLSQPKNIYNLENFKDFFACKIVLEATHHNSENVQKLFRLQNCRSRKSAISWKHSKIFPPAKMSQPQSICILDIFKDFFGCKDVLAANHLYPGNIQRLFRLQKSLSSNPSKFSKYSKALLPAKFSSPQNNYILEKFKDFFACKIVLEATHHNSEKVQKLFRLQNCRSRKSAISWKHSKIFPPAKLSQQQPINILKIFNDFFACKNVLAANHLYPGNIQRLFRLQKSLSSNPSKFSKYSKTLPPAKLSQPQISDILETFEDFFACKFFLAANQRYPGNIRRFFRLQIFRSRKSAISWKHSKTFSPAKLSQQQLIIFLKMFKNFFACKIVSAANQRYTGNFQRFFCLQKCLSRNPSIF